MLTRRATLMGAALAASAPIVLANTAAAATDYRDGTNTDLSNMPRIKHKLVAPPLCAPA